MATPTMFAVNPEIDSFSELNEKPVVSVNGTQVTYRQFPASSWSSNNITWQVQPPSVDVYINRAIQKVIPLTISYTGDAGLGNLLLADGSDALRSLPALRFTTNEIININGVGFPSSQNFEIYPEILVHYSAEYKKRHPLSAPDITQQYADAIGGIGNPLGNYTGSDTLEGSLKRGAYVQRVGSITRTQTTATIQVDVLEWVHIPQLLGLDCVKETGLTRVRSLDVNSVLDLSAQKVVSSASANVATASVVVSAIPQLLVKFITPPREMIPRGTLRYKHSRLERFITAYGQVCASNSSVTFPSNNIQLPYVPRYMFAFVREADNYKTFKSTDTFMRLDNVSINFNNQTGVLSTAPISSLWEISKQCGLLDSLPMFAGLTRSSGFQVVGTAGSLFCAEFGRHISLGDPSLSIGSSGSFNFNVQVTATNVNQGAVINNPTLYLIVVYDQVLVIGEGGEITFETPQVPVGDIASGEPFQVMYDTNGLYGGGIKEFFQKIGDWFKRTKILSTLGKVIGPALAPFTGPVGPQVASVVTSGLERMGLGEGGAVMSKRELKKMIKAL
jgi:hypothetical protein